MVKYQNDNRTLFAEDGSREVIRYLITSSEPSGNYDLIVKPWGIDEILGFGLKIKNFLVSLTYQAGFINTHPEIINERFYSNDRKS